MKKYFCFSAVLQCMMIAGAYSGSSMVSNAANNGNVDFMKIVQQSKRVNGTVVDETGEPLIGATVSIGAGVGVVTDLDGNFVLNQVPENAVMTVSYVGYQEQKISLKGKNHVKVTLVADQKTIDEVVVIGYGVQKKTM